LAVQLAMLSLRAEQHCIGKLVSLMFALLLVLFSTVSAGADFWELRLAEKQGRQKHSGLRQAGCSQSCD
jgi:hypothetical protein